jgi:hypothetical protein
VPQEGQEVIAGGYSMLDERSSGSKDPKTGMERYGRAQTNHPAHGAHRVLEAASPGG